MKYRGWLISLHGGDYYLDGIKFTYYDNVTKYIDENKGDRL